MENGKRSSASTKTCKKHPKHQQSPGVCSLCLRERLSKISSTSSRAVTNVSSSSSSSTISSVSSVSSSRGSSNGPSYTASPMHNYLNQRKTYDVERKGYLSFLRKSRSMAFVSENIVEIDGKQKKSNGFWSKLIGSKRSDAQKRSMEESSSSRLMHSKTMREMLTTSV
ncbi:uncharacterized serine-rich protein C215.13 [Lactuca sativa]|uniref:Uncharacterized protein n=1 Tax=Lactuca sativa TaxID=4236 RepID=A0A9R1WR08_LACSA|nr:uncharacterized serine-rich protein C215.13 [Lactuca sativa]KAJ0185751.1 hypothetical protein LSAT_V11C900486340 [Lactuca sativa]